MGANLVEYNQPHSWQGFNDDKLNKLLNTGEVQLEVDEIKIVDGTFEYKGQKVIVYIRDQYAEYYSKGYKFHLTNCSSISNSFKNKRNSRYVVSLRTDGKFKINLIKDDNYIREGLVEELKVCKNCLKKSSYKGYKIHPTRIKNTIYSEFNLQEYFKTVANSNLNPKFFKNSTNAPLNIYNKDFKKTSLKHREANNFTCENCKVDLSQYTKFCHLHHVDGNKSNDSPYNLKVLCIECHSDEPSHTRLRLNPDYLEFKQLIMDGSIIRSSN